MKCMENPILTCSRKTVKAVIVTRRTSEGRARQLRGNQRRVSRSCGPTSAALSDEAGDSSTNVVPPDVAQWWTWQG